MSGNGNATTKSGIGKGSECRHGIKDYKPFLFFLPKLHDCLRCRTEWEKHLIVYILNLKIEIGTVQESQCYTRAKFLPEISFLQCTALFISIHNCLKF